MKTQPTITLQIDNPDLRTACDAVCELVRTNGGRALLVGGCVRDSALGLPAKDLDIEVYGIEAAALETILSRHFAINLVGQAFGVIKIQGLPIDVALPRRESKHGCGHRGFIIDSDPQMDPVDAASRRDFTVNALALDPITGEIVDPFGGLDDLARGVLRHVSTKFSEDPLRVLRGMQFAARLDFEVSPDTIEICRTLELEGLAAERIFDEWKKLILLGVRPSRGLTFLRDCGWVRFFPELHALIDCPQDPEWHPEGDVWIHTLHCMDAFAARRVGDEREDLVVGLAVLCHDLGKPKTTKSENGRITSKDHSSVGEGLTRTFLSRMTGEVSLMDEIIPLVSTHLAPIQLFKAGAGDAAVRRLARRVGRIDRLVRVAHADMLGRPPLQVDTFEAGDWLTERTRSLEIEDHAPKPIVMGRHLIQLGLKPGAHFGPILEACFNAQIEGEFDTLEAGIAYADPHIRRSERGEVIATT
ncbi:MAG TPA: HD domain-containing protein [Nitrospirales bacterium]|nr:HD domain-containing protein [Nitrospirales bacterium]